MIRNLLVVLGLLLCFAIGGAGLYRFLSNRGETPFLKVSAADLAGNWHNKAKAVKIETSGESLQVDKVEFLRDGKAPRWVEKSPQDQIPRVLEYSGAGLTLVSVDDRGERRSENLERVP